MVNCELTARCPGRPDGRHQQRCLSLTIRNSQFDYCGLPPVRSFSRQSNGMIRHLELVLPQRAPSRAAGGAASTKATIARSIGDRCANGPVAPLSYAATNSASRQLDDRRDRHRGRRPDRSAACVCSDTNSRWMASSCCASRSPVYASLRSRPLPTAPRPSARYSRGSLNSGRIVFSISSSVTLRPAARNLVCSNAPGICRMLFVGIGRAAAADRIVVDDGLEHERVVGVHPERHLLLARPAVVGRGGDVERARRSDRGGRARRAARGSRPGRRAR